MTVTQTAPARKTTPRKTPDRSIGVVFLARKTNEATVIRITEDAVPSFYAVTELDCEIGGRAFGVHKLGEAAPYHVRVGKPSETSCECLGWLRHRKCRHVAGLAALIADGRLPVPADPWEGTDDVRWTLATPEAAKAAKGGAA